MVPQTPIVYPVYMSFISKSRYNSADMLAAVRRLQRERKMPAPDITIRNEVNVFRFYLHSTAAQDWVESNVNEPVFFCGGIIVEYRYGLDIASAMQTDGLRLA